LSTVTGIIDGTGSLGAALGQVAVPNLQVKFGWHMVFYLFMVSMFLTTVCIIKIFFTEMRDLCRQKVCGSGHPAAVLRDLDPADGD
jgi:OPA family glycerol-3-phosphate transporter-like MFS transporter 3